MSMLDGILGQLGSGVDVANLAEKIGLPADKVEMAIGALAKNHSQDNDTIEGAAADTGIEPGKLSQIVEQIGGEGSLTEYAGAISGDSGLMSKLSGMVDRDGDGNPLNDLADMASGFLKK